jgi:hypothetical protein
MVRRTRSEIKKYYTEDIEQQGLTFPTLGTPEKIVYTYDGDTDKAFNDTLSSIKNLSYARYKPLTYLKDTKKYATMLIAQRNMGGFMKSILVKRLESSFYAFRMTLTRFIQSHKKFITMYNGGEIYISKKVDVYDLLDNGDDDKLMQLVENDKAQHFTTDEFNDDFIKAVKKDLQILESIYAIWDKVDSDPKLDQFIHELSNNKILQGTKKIIFTESTETANYIGGKLKSVYGERVITFSGNRG